MIKPLMILSAILTTHGFAQTEASLASGMTYLLHENLMLDISLRVGLNDEAPDVGMATGFTVRF